MANEGRAVDRINTGRAHSARVYDYILGGKDHYPVDAEAGEAMRAQWPALPVSMRANRRFMTRVGRYLAREQGIRQFLDIGTGLPTSPNLHEVVQEERPDASIVYVDKDPIVLAHAQALLTSSPEGRTAYIDADMRDPEAILGSPEFRDAMNPGEPVGLLLIAMLQFIIPPDDHSLIRRLLDPLPPGSFLAMSMVTGDFAPEEVAKVTAEYNSRGIQVRMRTRDEVEALFDGLDMVEPGLQQVHRWRPGADDEGIDDRQVGMYGAVARKP
ncbi:SAM-dependent methyltransferase [Streptomyces sp. NPDC055078]